MGVLRVSQQKAKDEMNRIQQILLNKNDEIEELLGQRDHLEERIKKFEQKQELLSDQTDSATSQREIMDLDLREKNSFLKDLERKLEESIKQCVEQEMKLEAERHQRMSLDQEFAALKERLTKVDDDRDQLRTQLFKQENRSKQLKLMENSTLKSNMTLEQELMSRTLDGCSWS